jgi:hypothetical protein
MTPLDSKQFYSQQPPIIFANETAGIHSMQFPMTNLSSMENRPHEYGLSIPDSMLRSYVKETQAQHVSKLTNHLTICSPCQFPLCWQVDILAESAHRTVSQHKLHSTSVPTSETTSPGRRCRIDRTTSVGIQCCHLCPQWVTSRPGRHVFTPTAILNEYRMVRISAARITRSGPLALSPELLAH